MKNLTKITAILLLLFLAGNGSANAQRGMRGDMDSTRMGRPGKRMDYGMRGDFRNAPVCRMRNDMNRGNMGRGRFIENIPDLTETQKKEIGDLRQSNMEEMKKVREETYEKMKSMREANRSKILNILTEEQKKYLESKVPIDKTETQKSN